MKRTCILILIVTVLLASGCGMSRLERDFGTSHKLALFNQTLDPKADKNLEPVTGLNGQAELVLFDKYIKSFEKETSAAVYTIPVGQLGK